MRKAYTRESNSPKKCCSGEKRDIFGSIGARHARGMLNRMRHIGVQVSKRCVIIIPEDRNGSELEYRTPSYYLSGVD